MKVVINARQMYMELSRPQMDMICTLLGWTLSGVEEYQRSSKDCWFDDENGNRVDWVKFRAHPTLVQLVEEGKMSKGLMIVEIPDGTRFDIMTFDDRHGPYSQDLHSYPYSGEIVVRREQSEWYPEGIGHLDLYGDEDEAAASCSNKGETMKERDWTKTKAVWDGEDWRFTEVPLEACPNWGGRTCFSRMELNYNGDDPVKAVVALRYWCEHED